MSRQRSAEPGGWIALRCWVVDRAHDFEALVASLPSVRAVVHVPYGEFTGRPSQALDWSELLEHPAQSAYDDVPFGHPLVILFSSGTTGLPKAIVHGHGGLLLEHLKNHALSWDLGPGDTMLWYTTTAWMMWNALVSGLLHRSSIVLIDGDPLHPSPDMQWERAARTGATLLGLSPGFIMSARAAGSRPGEQYDLGAVRQIGSAGSPLCSAPRSLTSPEACGHP